MSEEVEMKDAPDEGDGMWLTKELEAHPPPDALPAGWVVRTSRSQPGCFYYYHQETGESRWEQPMPEPTASVSRTNTSPPKQSSPPSSNTTKADKPAAPTTSNNTVHKHSVPTAVEEPPAKKAKRDQPKEVRTLHILKKHKDSRRPSSWRVAKITATKEEARQELEGLLEVLQEVKGNPDELRATFEELARTESDCSSAKRGGDLGFFGRKKMQPPFEQASFALGIGEMSEIVDSSSGLHIILRVG
jgi:NIMA-interacting peptidyl-prolyl cis-trans isomerase 1